MSAHLISLAAINGFLVVSIGAFGAHALQARLTETGMLATFETGVLYHMFHTVALLAIAVLAALGSESRLLSSAAYLFLLGIVLFSGSLYVLSLSGISWLGAITPLGGVAFLAAWGCLAWYGFTVATSA
ncbi:MAG: DUF423 domain-containing protein [Pseudohongiellaceae bacterium]|jgi:uncharacterized membrane protein YgdD (TMEM256/DUF423 family)